MSHFYAMLFRMKYIDRWALMRNTRKESLAEHTLETAFIAHALAVIHNKRFGGSVDADKAAVLALFHDAPEIITGDLPTPIKYYNSDIKNIYKEIESAAEGRLLELLPDDLRPEFENCFETDDPTLKAIVKAADKLSAYIKCAEEVKAGNREFVKAMEATRKSLDESDLPEVRYFMDHYMEGFNKTLDEMN